MMVAFVRSHVTHNESVCERCLSSQTLTLESVKITFTLECVFHPSNWGYIWGSWTYIRLRKTHIYWVIDELNLLAALNKGDDIFERSIRPLSKFIYRCATFLKNVTKSAVNAIYFIVFLESRFTSSVKLT